MAIPPIGAGVAGISSPVTSATSRAAGAAGSEQLTGSGFAEALDKVASTQQHADQMGTQLATGQLADIHDFMAASTKASLAVELTVAVRNRDVEAYQEIMRMQV